MGERGARARSAAPTPFARLGRRTRVSAKSRLRGNECDRVEREREKEMVEVFLGFFLFNLKVGKNGGILSNHKLVLICKQWFLPFIYSRE